MDGDEVLLNSYLYFKYLRDRTGKISFDLV